MCSVRPSGDEFLTPLVNLEVRTLGNYFGITVFVEV
jgi:hypothetical protein